MRARALLAAGAGAVLVAAAPAVPAPPGGATVVVAIEGLRSARGRVLACLTTDARTFPDCDKDPAAHKLSVAAAPGEVIEFRGVAPGRYAISLFHDENGNGRLDKLMMIPREGYGFSRDAPVRFGPPRFTAAAFEVPGGVVGESVREAVHVRYMF